MNIGKGKIWTIILVPLGGFLLWGILGNLLDHLLDSVGFYEKVMSLNPQNWFRQFYLLTVPVWKLLLSLIISGIPTWFLLRDKITVKRKKDRRQQIYDLIDEFKIENRFVELDDKSVKYRTNISLSNDRVILESKSEPYCLKHNHPIKMRFDSKHFYFKCGQYPCENLVFGDMSNEDILILSKLENMWYKRIDQIVV